MSKLVVFVPGILGSELRSSRGKVWPPSALEVLFKKADVDEIMTDDIRSSGVISQVGPKAVYKTILRDIKDCGYIEGDAQRRFVPFHYDWRKSNDETAALLAERLDTEWADMADPEIILIAHSMGGLVARYLIESQQFEGKPWFGAIEKLVTLGTPHQGAPVAYKRLIGHEGTTGLSGAEVKKLGNDDRYPALAQLVATERSALIVSETKSGQFPEVLNPFDSSYLTQYGLSVANARRAEQFWSVLNNAQRPSHIEYFCFAGGAQKTAVRYELRRGGAAPIIIERDESGDGTVPFVSGILPGVPHGYSCKKHVVIFEDRKLRRKLFQILDAPSYARPQSADTDVDIEHSVAVGISLDKDEYHEGENFAVTLSYSALVDEVFTGLRIIPINPETEEPDREADTVEVPLKLSPANGDEFTFIIKNELPAGFYELRVNETSDDPTANYFYVISKEE